MGKARKEWQDFKNKVPNFEKSKSFKSDVGPQLDDVENLIAKAFGEASKMGKILDELEKGAKSLSAAMKGYKAVAEDLKKAKDKDFMTSSEKLTAPQFLLRTDLIGLMDLSDRLGKQLNKIAPSLDN